MSRLIYFLILFSPLFLGADKLSDAFTNGSIDGEAKLFYYNVEKETASNSYATSAGGYLKYSTDTSQDFYGSVRFNTSQLVGNTINPHGTYLFNNDKNVTALTVNSEAFLAWRGSSNRTLRIGNLMLETPLMNDDTTRIVPWSYQGLAYTGTAYDDTKIQLYYISKLRSNTSDVYTTKSASGEIGSGITMLGLHYNGFDAFELKSFYYYAPDLYSTFIAEAKYKYIINEERLFCFGIQYFNSGNAGKYNNREDRNGGDDINLIALKLMYDAENWMVNINYSQNYGVSGITKAYGGLAKVFTTSMIANGRGNYKPETWMFKGRYDLPTTVLGNTELALWLTQTRVHDVRGNSFDAYYMHIHHYFSAFSSLYIRYESMNYLNTTSDATYLRMIAQYDF